MNPHSLSILENTFKKYYFDNFDLLHVPRNSYEREFAYKKFDTKLHRHIALKSDKELRLLLITQIPSDIYCSNARYSFPTLSMNEKDWKNADLIFDIDSKDLQLPCRNSHTCIQCLDCNVFSTLCSRCPNCNSNHFKTITLLCKNCINAAKDETKKLCALLINNLGIQKQSIFVYFSGNDGFHIHVIDSQYQNLGSRERADIVDYIMLRNILPATINKNRLKFKNPKHNQIRNNIITDTNKTKNTSVIKTNVGATEKNTQHIIKSMIDPNVTIDIHRIFRLPGSINSKSSMSKILCKNLDRFNPFNDACFIDAEPIKIRANCPIEFILKDRKFGPFENEYVTIPKYAAMYMICKGLAEIL